MASRNLPPSFFNAHYHAHNQVKATGSYGGPDLYTSEAAYTGLQHLAAHHHATSSPDPWQQYAAQVGYNKSKSKSIHLDGMLDFRKTVQYSTVFNTVFICFSHYLIISFPSYKNISFIFSPSWTLKLNRGDQHTGFCLNSKIFKQFPQDLLIKGVKNKKK